jgi:hypothetical protein
MTQPFRIRFGFSAGFVPNQSPDGPIPGSVIAGSNVLFTGMNLFSSFKGMGGSAGGGAAVMWLVGSETGGWRGATGSLIKYRGGSYWYIGPGATLVRGAATTYSGSADLAIASGSYNGPAGLSAPDAPVLASAVAANGKLEGTYSIKVTRVRSTTGAEGNASEASNVEIFNATDGKWADITFPATADGQDKWGLYCTRRGFGATGPWYWYKDIAIGSTADQTWYDGDLKEIFAPFEYDLPPDGTHCFALGSVMNVAGISGNGIAPSIAGKPEAFPADTWVYLNPNEEIIGVTGRGTDGWQYIICRNSLHAAILTGSSINPLISRPIWTDTGFASAKGCCLVETEMWGVTGQGAFVRTRQQGEPDSSFAMPVESYIKGWTAANVAVGYSPADDLVVFGHGTEMLAYNRKTAQWSTPLSAGFTIASMIAANGTLYVSDGTNLYAFGGGSGTSWSATSAFSDGGEPMTAKTARYFQVTADHAVDWALHADLSTATVTSDTTTDATSGDHVTATYKLNARRKVNFAVTFSGTGQGQSVYGAVLDCLVHENHRRR